MLTPHPRRLCARGRRRRARWRQEHGRGGRRRPRGRRQRDRSGWREIRRPGGASGSGRRRGRRRREHGRCGRRWCPWRRKRRIAWRPGDLRDEVGMDVGRPSQASDTGDQGFGKPPGRVPVLHLRGGEGPLAIAILSDIRPRGVHAERALRFGRGWEGRAVHVLVKISRIVLKPFKKSQ